jgi:hypothetical protein
MRKAGLNTAPFAYGYLYQKLKRRTLLYALLRFNFQASRLILQSTSFLSSA